MKKRNQIAAILLLLLTFLPLLQGLQNQASASSIQPTVGPIYVSTAAELTLVRNNLSAHYIQTANIDLGRSPWSDDSGWLPIGTSSTPFTGIYDGNGYNITNLTINRKGEDYIGLFGCTGSSSQLIDISLTASVNGADYTGALVGLAEGPVTGCTMSGTVNGALYTGGLIGEGNTLVQDCHANATVFGERNVGVLIGSQYMSHTSYCSSTGVVTGTDDNIGGLVGYVEGDLIGCSSSASVEGYTYLGGLAGGAGSSFSIVDDCSASGDVTSNVDVNTASYSGGLAGFCLARVEDSWASGTVIGQNSVGGLIGYQPQNTIIRSEASGLVVGYDKVGGLVGQLYKSNIEDCRAYGDVTGNNEVGGLVGRQDPSMDKSLIDGSGAQGSVSGNDYVGGLCGFSNGNISNSVSYGDVSGNYYTGGLTGKSTQVVTSCDSYSSVDGFSYVGGISGSTLTNGFLLDCHAYGMVVGYSFVGGVVGDADAPIYCSSAETMVVAQAVDLFTSNDWAGGLAGIARENCLIASSYFSGSVLGRNNVGGLVGLSYCTISDSYAEGNLQGSNWVGGLVGSANGADVLKKYILSCYASCSLPTSPAPGNAGGLVGYLGPNAQVTDSYYDSTVSGMSDAGKGEPRTSSQLQNGTPSPEIFNGWSLDKWRFDPVTQYPWLLHNRPLRIPVDRLAGSNRYLTSAKVSQMGWSQCTGGTDTVILAVGSNYPDSLAGVSLAHALNAPILLTATNSLPGATLDEIVRLGASKVLILGGTGAVSEAVADQVSAIDCVQEVTRIAGSNRYDTARLIASREEMEYDTIFLASGLDFPDALSAAAYAARLGRPILLNGKTTLSASIKTLLSDRPEISHAIIVGGTSAISIDVENELKSLGISVDRIAGSNRYNTSLAMADAFWYEDCYEIFLATGTNFPDALAGGVLAAKQGSGVVLVSSTASTVPEGIRGLILSEYIRRGTVLGGTSAVSSSLENDLFNFLYTD